MDFGAKLIALAMSKGYNMEVPPIESIKTESADAQQRGMFLADICDATGEIDLNKLLMQIKTCNPQNSPTLAEHMPLIFTLAYKYGCLKRRMKDGTKCSGKEKVDLPVLQPYDDKNPREFLEKFEMRYGGLETTSQHQLFKEYLSGGALIAYKALKIEDYNNFKEFADAWIENYKPNFSNKRREIILEQLLINNSRKADSPIQYINRLQGWINELSELRHLPDSEIAKYWLAAARGLKRYDEIFDYYCSSNRENSLLKAKVLAALKKETQRDPTYKKENTGPSTTKKDFRKKVNLIECDKPIDVSDDDNKILNVYRLVLNGKKSVVVCNVQGKESNCLLDSGAEVSLITISKVKEIHPLSVIKKNPRIIVSDVQNQPLHLLGSVELLVEDILVSMLVVQSLNNIDAILGTNALSKSPVLQSKLQKLWSVNNISPDTTVEKLLSNYDVVASSGFHKPSSKIPPITFELLDEKPVQQKSRPIPVAVFQDLQVQIKEMEQMGVIVESESPYNSPILPVKKPDGSIRMCLDFVKVNQHIRYKNLPLPLIDNIFVQLENKSVFSTMDLNKGYWQLKLSPEAQVITAFNFGVKHYQFAVLPFGLSVAPGIFQKIMQMVLKPVLEKYPTDVYIYIDDILVATSSTTLHLQILNEIFQLLQKYELKLNLKKSKFLQKEVSYLGMRLTSSGLAMSPEKLRKVMDFPIPQNKKTLLSFLGLANFLRRFLKNYTIDSKPLYDLSTQPTFTWTEQALESFQKVKKSLLEAPILTAPNFAKALDESWPFFLVTDASKIGIGAVLLQKVNGDMKIIAMFNRSLHGSEKNYPPTDLEALAISAALTHMNLILYGVPVTIITDHQCLTYIFSKPNLSTRLNKWKLHMQQYRIKTIKYMEGKSNFIADCLSRCLKVVETGNAEQFPAIQICSINRSFNWDFFPSRPEWQELQQRDEHIQLLYTFLDGTNKSNDITVLPKHMQKLSNFKISQDKLVTTLDGKIVIPKSTVSHLCRLLHKSHEGYAIMVDRIQRKFSCVGFTTIVKSFLSNCSACYKNKELRIPKTNRKIKYSLMQKAYVDIGYSEAYSSFFITLVEAYSNYTFASWISNMRAITVIKFIDQIIQLTGTFDMIQFDNQSNFRSKELTDYLCSKGIEPHFSILFEHYTNGKAERMVKTLKYDLQRMYDDNIPKTKAIQKVLEKSRQTPYGKDNEKYTPLQRFFQDKNRELSNTISPVESTTIIPLFLHGYYRPRPDINADWEPCYVLQKINNSVYVIMEPGRRITRRTSRYVKLTSQPLSDEIVTEAKSKLEGCNI